MPKFTLYLQMEGENIDAVEHSPVWCLDVQQASGTEVREKVMVALDEEHEIDNSRGVANFVMKWSKQDKKQSYIKVDKIVSKQVEFVDGSELSNKQKMVEFDCRGIDIIGYHPMDNFTVVSSGGGKFPEADLSEEWADYDDENDLSVSIMKVTAEIE
eukprot:TRINITY_DN6708_c0_g1_i1.p1 TRINITY_DN6708_c0_g1~~TRINITY_DN6708_c0_g1_i1.p1  ORF type:complete len:157 (+),score=35.47 TRINITY_DN6708_c0_g1_i1:52-522(+)